MTLKAICGYAGVFLAIAGVALLVAQMIVGGIDLVFDTRDLYLMRSQKVSSQNQQQLYPGQ